MLKKLPKSKFCIQLNGNNFASLKIFLTKGIFSLFAFYNFHVFKYFDILKTVANWTLKSDLLPGFWRCCKQGGDGGTGQIRDIWLSWRWKGKFAERPGQAVFDEEHSAGILVGSYFEPTRSKKQVFFSSNNFFIVDLIIIHLYSKVYTKKSWISITNTYIIGGLWPPDSSNYFAFGGCLLLLRVENKVNSVRVWKKYTCKHK